MPDKILVTFTCEYCGKTVTKFSFRHNPRFCSTTCSNRRRKNGEDKTFICKYCGKTFHKYVIPSMLKQKTLEFCSQTCHNRSRRTHSDEYYSRVPIRKIGYLKPIPCPACGKMFKPHQSAIRFCSRACAHLMRRTNKGKMKTPQSVINAIKTLYPTQTAKDIGSLFGKSEAAIHFIARKIGVHLTREQLLEKKKQIGLKRRGQNNTLWLGGTKNLPWGKDWNKQRIAARERDKYTCQVCGASANTVHHITPRRLFVENIDRANDLSNLITLCAHCHRLIETGKIPCPRPK